MKRKTLRLTGCRVTICVDEAMDDGDFYSIVIEDAKGPVFRQDSTLINWEYQRDFLIELTNRLKAQATVKHLKQAA